MQPKPLFCPRHAPQLDPRCKAACKPAEIWPRCGCGESSQNQMAQTTETQTVCHLNKMSKGVSARPRSRSVRKELSHCGWPPRQTPKSTAASPLVNDALAYPHPDKEHFRSDNCQAGS